MSVEPKEICSIQDFLLYFIRLIRLSYTFSLNFSRTFFCHQSCFSNQVPIDTHLIQDLMTSIVSLGPITIMTILTFIWLMFHWVPLDFLAHSLHPGLRLSFFFICSTLTFLLHISGVSSIHIKIVSWWYMNRFIFRFSLVLVSYFWCNMIYITIFSTLVTFIEIPDAKIGVEILITLVILVDTCNSLF